MLSNTRCPVCASTFAVTPETLALANGWVRCGRCANVFEAGANRPMDATVALSDPAQSDRRLNRIFGKFDRSMARAKGSTGASTLALEGQTHTGEVQVKNAALNIDVASVNPHIAKRSISLPPGDHSAAQVGTESVARLDPQPSMAKRSWRVALPKVLGRSMALSVLALGLLLQVVLAYRTEAATYYPQMRPALQALCTALGCQVAPLTAPEQLSVESTAFQLLETPKAGASHLFSWHVRNLALFPVKAPALELSLTDALDRPILRKVLLPRDLGLPAELIEPDGQWMGELPISVAFPQGSPTISGYRVTAFYP